MNSTPSVRLKNPKHPAYSAHARARFTQVDTERGTVVHTWPSGLINVVFTGAQPFEVTLAPADVELVATEKAA